MENAQLTNSPNVHIRVVLSLYNAQSAKIGVWQINSIRFKEKELSMNRHLIADHLGWFKELTKEGKHPTVEELVKAKGEMIKGKLNLEGNTEYFE